VQENPSQRHTDLACGTNDTIIVTEWIGLLPHGKHVPTWGQGVKMCIINSYIYLTNDINMNS